MPSHYQISLSYFYSARKQVELQESKNIYDSQIISKDDSHWWQARKDAAGGSAGLVPSPELQEWRAACAAADRAGPDQGKHPHPNTSDHTRPHPNTSDHTRPAGSRCEVRTTPDSVLELSHGPLSDAERVSDCRRRQATAWISSDGIISMTSRFG